MKYKRKVHTPEYLAARAARKKIRIAAFNIMVAKIEARAADPIASLCRGGMDRVQHTLPASTPGVRRTIFAALYPPAKAEASAQHDNHTSRVVAGQLGDHAFDWIDVFPYSPKVQSGDLDQYKLANQLKTDHSYGKDWLRRLMDRIREEHGVGNLHPVVYIAGKTCQQQWDAHGPPPKEVLGDHITLCHTPLDQIPFIAVVGRPHPSAAMKTAKEQAKIDFATTMSILRACRLLLAKSTPMADLVRRMSTMLSTAEQNRLVGQSKVQASFGVREWSTRWSMLRLLRYDEPGVVEIFQWMGERFGNTKKLGILLKTSITNRLGIDPALTTRVKYLIETHGIDSVTTLLCDGVAARLMEPDFWARMRLLIETYGIDSVTTLLCNGVAARLMEPEFWARLRLLIETHGIDSVTTLLCNSVANRLMEPDFWTWLDTHIKAYGIECVADFMGDSVASRIIAHKVFRKVIDEFTTSYGFPLVARAMSNEMAIALGNGVDGRVKFEKRLVYLRDNAD